MAINDYKDHKKRFVTFRVSPEERQLINKYARSKGMTTNSFLYSLVRPILEKQICVCGRNKINEKEMCSVCLATQEYELQAIKKELK